MDANLTHLLNCLNDPGAKLDLETVGEIQRQYPFFTLPAIMALKGRCGQLSEQQRREFTATVALNTADPAAVMQIIDRDSELWADFYPTEKAPQLTTDDAIATFLDTYGHTSPQEDALLERLIFNPTPDYSTMLAREEESSQPQPAEAEGDSCDALINSFILKSRSEGHFPSSHPQPDTTPAPAPAPPEVTDHPVEPRETIADTSLSESLAKIYIKQRRYDKAYEIISTLSLNNPKKSVYFADQLRFLQKLMLNSSHAKG